MKKIFQKFGLVSLMLATAVFGFGGVLVAQAATFTAADVATHNTASDCWVIINNNVYNLTSFIPNHPGGPAIIIAQCGKDGTAVFNSGPHSSTTLNAISSLLLGTLTTSTTTTPVLTSVTLTPVDNNVLIGGTLQLVVNPLDQNGASFVGTTTTFASSDHAVATVDNATGLVNGISDGSSTITATTIGGGVTITTTKQVTVSATAVLGSLAAQDFGVVNYDTGTGILKGYTAGFGVTNATLAGATSVVVKLYNGNTLLQTNTAILPKFNANVTGTQFSSPFDVSGTFAYATDGYWTNTRASQYGQSLPATKVVSTVTLANGKVVTAENTTLTGDPTTIMPTTQPGGGGNGGKMENENDGNDNESAENEHKVTGNNNNESSGNEYNNGGNTQPKSNDQHETNSSSNQNGDSRVNNIHNVVVNTSNNQSGHEQVSTNSQQHSDN